MDQVGGDGKMIKALVICGGLNKNTSHKFILEYLVPFVELFGND